MALGYKVVERAEPGVVGGGQKKYYASSHMPGEMTMDDLIKAIEKMGALTKAEIHGVMYSMVDAMENMLKRGYAVRLGDLGSMRLSISSEGKDTAEEVSAASIRGAKVLFTPGKNIKKLIKDLEYRKLS
jgi:predicted histone-like DNA-binding protein